jgi:hypothetical protein
MFEQACLERGFRASTASKPFYVEDSDDEGKNEDKDDSDDHERSLLTAGEVQRTLKSTYMHVIVQIHSDGTSFTAAVM